MTSISAVSAFAALAQETRLAVFRILLEHGRAGLPAGRIGARLAIPHNTLSFHLSHLKQAGLVSCTRQGRQLIYVANTDAVENLIAFLSETCCIHDESATDCELGPAAPTAPGLCGDRS